MRRTDKQKKSIFSHLKAAGNFCLKWRYFLAVLLFITGVSLELHGSSISNWNNFGVSETVRGEQSQTLNTFSADQGIGWVNTAKNWIAFPPRVDGTIVGVPRMIRSDEWLVQTPFAISQANTGNQLVNPSYGLSGMNMVLAYNSPVADISVIGKPFNWGFLFLGASRGLSWYWCFKILGMLLLAFEFAMILTGKNKFLSVLGSLWITFTPSVQWWFMQHLGDIVYFSLAIMVAVYHYFQAKTWGTKLGLAGLLSSSIIGFVLVIYPAFQVPFAYLILFFFLIQFYSALAERKVKKWDWMIMVVTIISSLAVIAWTLLRSWDALRATMDTVYPGSRVSLGGDSSILRFSDLFVNLLLPFKYPAWTNQVEASSSISLLPIFFLSLPFIIKRKDFKDNIFGLFLIFFSCLLAFFAIVGIPEFLAKLTLFSFVTGGRAWQAMSVMSVFASIWILAKIWEQGKNLSRKTIVSLSLVSVLVLTAVSLLESNYAGFVGKIYLAFFSFLLVFLLVFASYQRKGGLFLTLMPLIFLSGMTVNPVVKGLSVLEDKSLSHEITSLVEKDGDALWLTETSAYNYPQMFGAKTINSVRFYPDLDLMAILDPEEEAEQAWNRYAHIRVLLGDQETQLSVGPAPDILEIDLSVDDLETLGVTYILTDRDLSTLYGSQFKEIYQDTDSNRIYAYQP